ncbi:MAG TPA: replication-relaxation family protein [Solirubrobacteraceae bacterium]|nr:replication-relaxation family protein [Solirubrobacteraceae bacterium]
MLEAKLTERDLAVLQRVSGLRFASGGQLTRLEFTASPDEAADARTARRALLRLVRLGALARLPRPVGGVRAGSAGFTYYLDVAGQRLAVRYGWQPERRGRRSHTPGTLFVRHALQVAELHTLLVEADRSRRFELLELRAEPACWRSWSGVGAQQPRLKPDSYVRLGVGAYEDSYFVEVDRGTEGSRALERQLQLYCAYAASGQEQAAHQVFPSVLWLVPNQQRVEAIEGCVGRQPGDMAGLFRVARFDTALHVMTEPDTGQEDTNSLSKA